MKRASVFLGVAAALTVAWSPGFAKDHEKHAAHKTVTFASSEQAEYKEVAPGISKSVLWEDAKTGAYGAFTRFVAGQDAGMHTHTHDVWILVIKGAYLYRDEAGEKRVGPGSFIRVPGGKKHWSGADKEEGAVFYEEGAGKFDLVPVK